MPNQQAFARKPVLDSDTGQSAERDVVPRPSTREQVRPGGEEAAARSPHQLRDIPVTPALATGGGRRAPSAHSLPGATGQAWVVQLVRGAALERSRSSPAAFRARMAELRAAQASGETLSEADANQLLAYQSNANFLGQRLSSAMDDSAAERAVASGGTEDRRVADALGDLRALTQPDNQGAVFTRDIDHGELSGLTHSRRLLSVNDRQQDRIGRVRKTADFNRGGGAGSYTRVVSHRRLSEARAAAPDPAHYEPMRDDSLQPLAVGSIGNAGITLAFDAAGAAADVTHPLEVFHNDVDSGGRVFGRLASDGSGRRVGRGSERILGRMNPDYYRRDASVPVAPFHASAAERTATDGQRRLRDIVEHPSGATDHNEQIWMKPPSLGHVKGVFIQKQLDRPPRLQPKTDAELQRERQKRQVATTRASSAHSVLDAGRAAMDPRAYVAEKAKLMSRDRKLAEPIARERVIDQSARLPKELRVPSFWRDGRPPKGYERLESLPGADGIPFADLVQHVNPKTKRAMLPGMAEDHLDRARAEHPARERARARARIAEAQRYHTVDSQQFAAPTLVVNGRERQVDLPPTRP